VYITLFDILILIALLIGAAMGFFRGFFRQASATLAIYLSLVVTTLSYRGLSRLLMGLTQQPSRSTDVLAFFLVLILMLVLLLLIGRDLLANVDIKRMGIWVNITGMIFGVLNAAIVCAVVLIVVRSTTNGVAWPGYSGLQSFLRTQVMRSWMAYILRPFMQVLIAAVKPWLFGHTLPPMLLNAF
jgi:uncharacterized membrane protein required for colicin V production